MFKSTQKQLIVTPFVLNKAVAGEGIMELGILKDQENPIEWLQENLIVDFPGNAEILQVSLTSNDRMEAMKLVNAVIEAYQQEVIESEKLARAQRLDSLQKVYNESEINARKKRSDLRKLAETLGTSDKDTLSLAQQGLVQQYALVRSELAQVSFDLMRARGEMEFMMANQPDGAKKNAEVDAEVQLAQHEAPVADEAVEEELPEVPELMLQEAVVTDRLSMQLQAELDLIEAARFTMTDAAYKQHLDRNASAMASLKARMQERRDLLENLIQDRMIQERQEKKEKEKQQLQRQQLAGGLLQGDEDDPMGALKVRVGVLELQEKTLLEEVRNLDKEVRKFGQSSVEVEMMRTEIDGLDAIVQHLGTEIERTKVELRGTPRITLLSEAEPGVLTDRKRPMMITGLATVVGLLLPGGLLVLRDFQKKRLSDLPSTRDELGLEILGTIPKLPRGIVRKPKSIASDLGAFEDQVRDSSDSVAATILRRAVQRKCQVLLVSSAMPREGKSSLACHLSISLGKSGKKVCVVDFDLRRPSMHSIFARPVGPGVGEILAGECKLADAIQATDIPGVEFVPAGVEESSVTLGATSGQLDALFAQLRDAYDFIIVDAGPVLGSPSTRFLAQPEYVDGVIMSTFKDVSQASQVDDAKRVLTSFGAPILGTVLSGYSSGMYYSYSNRPKSQSGSAS
ncbi:tyrosine-protein kinase domain-containing protein [Blastopirellula marina]|uniref:tyrosine-protein kinase domain-containing protein n=1 Tax=Blastopirellula marina TaxID=124 RepID=UPI00130485A6|nr:tyrosine-protein kinase domain-containing protein [Blastopirellula marina]